MRLHATHHDPLPELELASEFAWSKAQRSLCLNHRLRGLEDYTGKERGTSEPGFTGFKDLLD